MTNVNRHVLNAQVAELDRIKIAVNNLETTSAAHCARQTAVRHRVNSNPRRGLVRQDRHSRAAIENEAQFLSTVDSQFDDGAKIDSIERNDGAVRAAQRVKRALLSEITQKINQTPN